MHKVNMKFSGKQKNSLETRGIGNDDLKSLTNGGI